uniref:Platelet glycoprotein 4 n=1 Tax=Oncorhynchus mykiss TaxID=8022 RepID=A0A8C7PVQ9_ONCMY
MGCCNKLCGLKAGIGAGIAVAILGIILIPVGNNIIRETVTKESVIEPGTTAWDNWVSADTPVYRQFWLFDVQNPQDVVENGSKPTLVEKGPYTYKTRYLPKENITANPENHTISFLLPAGAIFEPSLSVGSEEDSVTSLNLAVAGGYKLLPPWVLEAAIKLNNVSLFQRRTVREILWGYKDPILKGTLGLFFPYNGTYDGPYNVFTGKDDISKVSIIDNGSSFSPFLDKKKPLYFFSPDISRSVSAEYERSLNLKGIEVYRFKLPPLTLASPAVNPDNQCFCTDSVVSKNCTSAGVLDISSSRGQPVYISLPHFLHGSPYLIEDVEGLGPSEEHHVTFLDVEPTTGFSLRFAKRLQVNMMYGPSKIITVLKKVKDYTVLPIVWLNEVSHLSCTYCCQALLLKLLNLRLLWHISKVFPEYITSRFCTCYTSTTHCFSPQGTLP